MPETFGGVGEWWDGCGESREGGERGWEGGKKGKKSAGGLVVVEGYLHHWRWGVGYWRVQGFGGHCLRFRGAFAYVVFDGTGRERYGIPT